ncbi:MAG: hypothetical protein BIFFINMI_00479 [Phycisphaerae bacterium]|nr:hypothetical protein [Phycisphaerae bacterium]
MTQATTIPHRADAGRPVVVYDGDCAFCRGQVDRMRRRDPGGIFEYVPRCQERLEERFRQIVEGDFNSGMRLIEPDGRVYVAADAVFHIARRLRGWRRLAWLYRVPLLHALFRWGYALVAKNRHRLARGCEEGTCKL